MEALDVLNGIESAQLRRILAHVMEKTIEQREQIFSPEELVQLTELLALSPPKVDELVASIQHLFKELGYYDTPMDQQQLAKPCGLSSEVLQAIDEVWQRHRNAFRQSVLRQSSIGAPQSLKSTNWSLHLELANSQMANQTNTKAIFQFCLKDPQHNNDQFDVEMTHDQLYVFFQQLNRIQQQLDQVQSSCASSCASSLNP